MHKCIHTHSDTNSLAAHRSEKEGCVPEPHQLQPALALESRFWQGVSSLRLFLSVACPYGALVAANDGVTECQRLVFFGVV